jgi:hypothetical protein
MHNNVSTTLGAASYQIATSTGSYSDTYSGTANQNWAMVAAAFKPATGASGHSTYFIHTDHLGGTNVTPQEGTCDRFLL